VKQEMHIWMEERTATGGVGTTDGRGSTAQEETGTGAVAEAVAGAGSHRAAITARETIEGEVTEEAGTAAGAVAEVVTEAGGHHATITDTDTDTVEGETAEMARTDKHTGAEAGAQQQLARPRLDTEILHAIGEKQTGMLAVAAQKSITSLKLHHKQRSLRQWQLWMLPFWWETWCGSQGF
jgi:hypothetical protein